MIRTTLIGQVMPSLISEVGSSVSKGTRTQFQLEAQVCLIIKKSPSPNNPAEYFCSLNRDEMSLIFVMENSVKYQEMRTYDGL